MRSITAALLLTAMNLSASTFYDHKIQALDGTPLDLSAFQGKAVLVVNVASKCGFTKQYDGLQKLHAEWKDRGLVVLGVPSNDFGRQEPGSPEEIATFCRSTYGVDFPLTEKIAVKGEARHPLYAFLTAGRGEPKWNFHKYLVGRDGKVLGEFPSKVTPNDPELLAALTAALSGS